MDRYEFDIKIEQIKKLMKKKDFATAVKIADSIEWKKVKENPLLIIAADVYEVSGKYDEAREVLLLAYEKTGLGRQLAYRLCRLSVKRGDFKEAEEFYDEFTHNSPYDAGKYILQYEMAKGKGESLETQISILETFIGEDMDDRWAFELAKLYHKAHLAEKCVELCDTIILWFADGKYVEKALELKQLYVPLSENQRIKYEAQKSKKDRMVAEAVQNLVDGVSTEQSQETEKEEAVPEVSSEATEVVEEVPSDKEEVSSESESVAEQEEQTEEILDQVHEMDIDVNSIKVKDFSKSNQYDTINIQKELAKSVSTLFDNTVEIFKPVAPKTTVDEEQVDDQIEGQMSLEEVLAMFESGEIQTRSEDEQVIEETPIEEVSEEEVVEVEEIFAEENNETEEVDEMEMLSQIIAEDIQEEILDEIEEVKEEENNLSMFNLKEDLEDEEPFEETLDEEIIEETEDNEEDFEIEEESSDMEERSEIEEIPEEEEIEDASEDDLEEESEEDSQEDDQEEETPAPAPVKQADIAKRELKRFISKFTGIKGLDKQILKVLQTALKTEVDPVKFIFVKGEVRSGKTTLAIEVIKVINRIIQRSGQKIAKIKAISLNDKSIEALIETLDGSDVLIERVSDMDIDVFIEFVEKLREEGKPRVVIFEDEKNLAEAFLEELPEEYADFTNVIDIKLNEIRDWATIAESYAKERGYTIDAMGTLALSAKIDQLKAVTKVIEKSHIEELIEEAIVNAEKFSVKKFFGKIFGKSKEGLKTLTEKNFI